MGKSVDKILKSKLTIEEIYIMLFPVAILFRSATLNLYVILGGCFFLYKFYKKKDLFFCKEIKKIFYLILLFFSYFILNSFGAENFASSIKSSCSQIRFLLFAFFISSLTLKIENLKKIIFILSLIVFLVSIDTLYQYFFGYDFFGIEADPHYNPGRLSGPFGKELIVGAYLTYFTIPLVAYFFLNLKDNKKSENFFLLITLTVSFLSILLSGERVSLIIFIVSFLIVILYKYKAKIFLLYMLFFIIFLSLGYKYNHNIKYRFDGFAKQVTQLQNSPHGKLFSSAFIVGKNKIWTGAGLKNYREDCDILKNKNFIDLFTKEKIDCSSHPHNIYLEIFSEGGLIGLSIFLTLIIYCFVFFRFVYNDINNKLKFIFISSLIILFSYIWPIKSSGSFFSTFSASFFWFYLGLVLLVTNTFYRKN